MGNTFVILKPVIHGLMKAVGMTSQLVEIEPGTSMHFWVPTKSIHPNNKLSNKPPVLFVHGFVANGIMTWLFQILSLSSDFAVYVPDLLFFGDSITTRPERSTSIQAECLAKGMMKLGVEKFSLVGLSYGGMVGFKLAQMYPHMVESMVMSSTIIEMTESISNASLKNIGFTNWPDFLLPKTVSGVKLLLSIGSHKLPWLPEFFYKDFHEAMFSNRKEKVELLEALVVNDKDATIKVPNYSQRIYILCGDDDKIFNTTFSDYMKEKLGKNTTIQYIKNAGHLVQLERPCTYNHYLKKLLSSS
ncbi:putative aminoacrylate hydrolase RutD [Solanum tuberosum]|uniref:Hydrolase, alpha/beta fold family protein n=1 Tax=Solanum tuberosum TaxID=4113 RepID=M0ZJC6_SOLTU|nr:PREDICTED: putative aminoacrylate hydrolase RutD [Solanum tuberosum]